VIQILDAIARPLTRLAVMLLVVAITWLFVRLGMAMSNGFDRWAAGEGVDLNGLGAALGGAAALLGVLMPFIVSLFRDRRIERVEQIRAGQAPPGPFGNAPQGGSYQPSAPPPDTLDPRPQGTHQ
jgi:hypothetical protein